MNNNFGMSNNNLDALLNSNSQILYYLGICFANGFGTGNPDHCKAVDCYMQSAVLGNIDSMYCLGLCYEHGWGVPCDTATAFELYRKADELGYKEEIQ